MSRFNIKVGDAVFVTVRGAEVPATVRVVDPLGQFRVELESGELTWVEIGLVRELPTASEDKREIDQTFDAAWEKAGGKRTALLLADGVPPPAIVAEHAMALFGALVCILADLDSIGYVGPVTRSQAERALLGVFQAKP